MNGEMLKLIQTLIELDGSVNIEEIVLRSGLSTGKVLGNLPRLCMDGFVDKHDRKYEISKKGRTVLRELKSVPVEKGFYFYVNEDSFTGLVANGLKDFYEIIKIVDVRSLEFHVQRHDFENWVRGVLWDKELASEIAKIERSHVFGEALRNKLCEAVYQNYKKLSLFRT